MAYRVSWELHIDIDEILNWTPDKFEMWVAFFQIQDEHLKKSQPKRPTRRGR